MPEWDAEVVVDEPLVRRLVGSQFPTVALDRLEPLGVGWDNAAWLVDGKWLFRFPRREIAVEGIERELVHLPRLAPVVPLPVPAPVFAGQPADGYPWPFLGARYIPGAEPRADIPPAHARSALATQLGRFLAALHAPATLERVDPGRTLPDDPMGRADTGIRVPLALERLAEVEELGLWRMTAELRRELDVAAALPQAGAPTVVHGDLHFRHLIVDAAGGIAGVIDWGDVCRGDPGVDLSLYWSFFRPEDRSAFLDAYGRVPHERLLRARVLAVFLCATLVLYARHEGMGAVEREALDGLERAAAT